MKTIKGLLPNIEIRHMIDCQADGQAADTSAGVDLANYEGGMVVCAIGTVTSTGTVTMKLQQSSDDGATDTYADVKGSSVTVTNGSNKYLVVDLGSVSERYIRAIVTRATANSILGSTTAYLYGANKMPVVQGTDVASSKSVVGEEGTA